MLTPEKAVELVNACLDGQKLFKEIVDLVRENTGTGLILSSDIAVKALMDSKHPLALVMLHRIKDSISRYANLKLPQFANIPDDGQ